MKKIIVVVFSIFISGASSAQTDTIVQYFDYGWKKCAADDAIYYRIAIKTDKGWKTNDFFAYEQKLQMEGAYSDDSMKISEGTFSYYYTNGKLEESGSFAHGKKTGFWMGYHENGQLNYTGNYVDGIPVGIHKHFYETKELSSIGTFDDKGSGQGRETHYFEDGRVSATGITCEGNKKDSIWVYYYRNGIVSYKEYFDRGIKIKNECFDEKGVVSTSKCDSMVMPMPDYDVYKYVGEHVEFPTEYKLQKKLKIYVNFTIDENGVIKNLRLMQHIHPAFDKAVLDGLSRMPKWNPGKEHNRPAKIYYTLPIVFKEP